MTLAVENDVHLNLTSYQNKSIQLFIFFPFFTAQPLRAVGVWFSPMVSRWVGGGEKFVRAVSQEP